MKEQIYTIPVNEAYDRDDECPLCELEKKLEYDAVKYALGAAMMEPDFRIESNEKGYCNHHFSQMFAAKNKLPLALVLETHLGELRKKIGGLEKTAKSLEAEKGGLFKKNGADKAIAEISEILGKTEKTCMVCEKVNHTMERYIDVLLYMWVNDDKFKEKFNRSRGVCLKHFKSLAEAAPKSIKGESGKFIGTLINKEIKELNRIQEDIHKFTLKFDYRNRDMELGEAVNAPIRTIEKISGYITPYEDNEQG
ncbi:MAG: ABC transporter substrate-binding protein [Oscillospiraceae bacterium]|nr:ABC transporter substrate-binding protein [Oscillospiraceae bacterium]